MLYIFEDLDGLPDDFLEQCAHYLSAQRREKAAAYRFPLDRKLSVTAFLLLRLALKENYCIDEPVAFTYGEHGKPYLRDYPHIHFSLSHCKSAVACAVSNSEIGVDIQTIITVTDSLAKRVLTEREYAAFKSAACPDKLFCEYWTAKESLLKKTGRGIATDLTALSAEFEKTLFKNDKYYCCVTGGFVGVRRVGIDEILL